MLPRAGYARVEADDMKASLVPGLRRKERITIDPPRTIEFLGEGMRIYSTPSMLKDVEYAGLKLIQEHLEENESSVGMRIAVDHLAATPLGHWVEVEVWIVEVEGRKVSLAAEVRDALELVGRAEHARFVIDLGRHAERLKKKAAKLAEARPSRDTGA
ncbi:MAG: thioesterase family protein [Vicinamibacteria bacterium]